MIVQTRSISNQLLLSPPSHSTPADSRVEWAYAFDVHTNAFFPLYLTLSLPQLFLLPFFLNDTSVSLFYARASVSSMIILSLEATNNADLEQLVTFSCPAS